MEQVDGVKNYYLLPLHKNEFEKSILEITIQFLLLLYPRWFRHYLIDKDQKETTVSTCQACG